jgi:mannose-6-phosphate isomerase-like protein (cupin superfamily)
MKRRSFLTSALQSAAALLPAAAIEQFAMAQAPDATTAPEQGHIVAANQDRFGETHSLGFSTILFKVAARDTNGGLFVIEHVNLMNGGPRLHLHLYQDEWFYVMEGEVLFQIADTRKLLRAGESVLGPRNVPHTFTPVGKTPAHMIIAFTPAGKMEQFFRDTAIPNGPKIDAALFRKYDMELVGPALTV